MNVNIIFKEIISMAIHVCVAMMVREGPTVIFKLILMQTM